jgi:hypothetical protein
VLHQAYQLLYSHQRLVRWVYLSLQCFHHYTPFPLDADLTTLTSPQPHRLAVLLQLGNELITLLDDVGVLLVLVVWSVGFDDAVDAVDGARDAVCCDEFGEVPVLGQYVERFHV